MSDYLEVFVQERNARYRAELEDYFRTEIVSKYSARAEARWHRDYASVDAYLQSVAPNRERWRGILGPPDLRVSGDLTVDPVRELDAVGGQFLRLPLDGPLRAEALYAVPKGEGAFPLVVCQHGVSSTPEKAMGVLEPDGCYHSFGRRLVEAGFAVLAPMNLFGSEPRTRICRMAAMVNTTLPGVELARLQRLLDVVLERPEIDQDRVGFWGLSHGGMAAQFFAPLEPRLKVVISAAWFNSRLNKMVVPDPRYSCFLDRASEHVWVRGWLTEFADADLLSLVCPRPLLITTGKADGIAWWPQVVEEFAALRSHYERLGLADRVGQDLHESGHDVRWDSGLAWMRKWLA